MVGAPDHEYAIVAFKPVDFVEKVGADTVRDDAVQIFEDEVAGGLLARLVEDGRDGVFRAADGSQGAHVKGWYRGGQVGEGVHRCFDGYRLAIA